MISFLRTIRFSLQSFWRNLWLSVVTVFILSLTMISLSLVGGVNVMTNQALQVLRDKVNIDVFLTPGLDEQTILGYQTEIEGYPEVQEVVYVSQDDALQNFLAEHASDSTIKASIESLGDNPFPASLVIKAKNLNDYDSIITKIEASEVNQHVQSKDFSDNRDIIGTLNTVILKVSQIGIIISGIFILISVIMIFNTIRIAIYSHRDELNIMKLVGATNWFIRGPFLIESLLYALVSATIASVVVIGVAVAAVPYLGNFFILDSTTVLHDLLQWIPGIILLEVSVACVLSLLSTGVALRRYLKA